MIEEKIKELIKVELDILGFNQELCNLEKMSGQDSYAFDNILKIYLQAIENEEKIFKNLTNKEASEIEKYLMNLNNEEKNLSYNFIFVIIRMINRLEERHMPDISVINFGNLQLNSNIQNEINETSKAIQNIKNAISAEYNDIYLSFLDEYISKETSSSRKNNLIDEKYRTIYTTNSQHEKELIRRKFKTDYSLYLTSELSCVTKNKNYSNIYNSFRRLYINAHLNSLLDKLVKNETIAKSEITILILKLRGYMLMLNEKEYQEITKELLKLDIETFMPLFETKQMAIDTFNKDKQRHKTLKLKI